MPPRDYTWHRKDSLASDFIPEVKLEQVSGISPQPRQSRIARAVQWMCIARSNCRLPNSKKRFLVKSIRNLKLLMNVGLLATAFGLFAGQGKAQSVYTGKFTLPVQARWGGKVLQPGNYTISLGDSVQTPELLVLRGEGKEAFIVASATNFNSEHTDSSKLILVDNGSGYAIQTLVAGETGITMSYAVPKVKNVKAGQRHDPMSMVSVLIAAN